MSSACGPGVCICRRAKNAWTDYDKALVLKGTLLSDIGKTGPKDAPPGQARLIVKMFAIQNLSELNAGGNTEFDRPEKLVILLDKYDAARERGHKTHAEAIRYLRDYIGESVRFADDDQFPDLIVLLEQSLA